MAEPLTDRPHIPGYGIPESSDGVLPWSWARDRLERAIVYWLATAGSDGAPHLVPIWDAWVDDHWYVEGGPVRWQRNLRANPRAAIHVEVGEERVMVEGTALELVAPGGTLARSILAGYAKYLVAANYEADASNWSAGALWQLTPIRGFAWSSLGVDATRYRFDTD